MTTEYRTKDSANENLVKRKKELARLTQLAMGNRSLSEYAHQTGLSIGFLSRLLNAKSPSLPSVRSLARLTSGNAAPENGITYHMMLEAAGYDLEPEKETAEQKILAEAQMIAEEEQKRESERRYGSIMLGASAMALILSKLFSLGFQLIPIKKFRKESFFEFRNEGEFGKKIVIIPGFRGNDGDAQQVMLDIVWQFSSCFRNQEDGTIYFILTDEKEVFQYLSDVLRITCGNIYILQADKDYKDFIGQTYIGYKNEGINTQILNLVKPDVIAN